MTKHDKESLKTNEVIERLAAKYPSPQYGFLTQVRNGTGYMSTRTADAIAMSLWPSRGLHLSGFEVKVSRTDWIKELKNPQKADEIAMYCHFWYLVVGDETIVQTGELPVTWGLIVPNGKGLKIVKEATMNQSVMPPDTLFLAGIMRNVAEQCTPNEVIQSRLDAAREKGEEWSKHSLERVQKELDELKEQCDKFEKASGVEIKRWADMTQIGKAVKDVMNGRDKQAQERLEKLLERARNLVKFMEGQPISSYEC